MFIPVSVQLHCGSNLGAEQTLQWCVLKCTEGPGAGRGGWSVCSDPHHRIKPCINLGIWRKDALRELSLPPMGSSSWFVQLSSDSRIPLCLWQGAAVPGRPGAHFSSRHQEDDAGQGAAAARRDGQRRGQRQRPAGPQPLQHPNPENQEELTAVHSNTHSSAQQTCMSLSTAARHKRRVWFSCQHEGLGLVVGLKSQPN